MKNWLSRWGYCKSMKLCFGMPFLTISDLQVVQYFYLYTNFNWKGDLSSLIQNRNMSEMSTSRWERQELIILWSLFEGSRRRVNSWWFISFYPFTTFNLLLFTTVRVYVKRSKDLKNPFYFLWPSEFQSWLVNFFNCTHGSYCTYCTVDRWKWMLILRHPSTLQTIFTLWMNEKWKST